MKNRFPDSALQYTGIFLVIAFIVLFFQLGGLPLTGPDEPRYARIAEEMRGGGTWVTPILEGKPWLEKPPLYYWIARPFYSIFDSPEIAARAGTAICALLTALAVYWAGGAIWTALAGKISALILLTTLGLAGFGRSATTDMPFTCFLTLSLAIFAVAAEKDIGKKIFAAYIFLGVATLGKGPVAVVLAAGAALIYWFLAGRGGTLRRWRPFSGLLITSAVALPWFLLAFRENGYVFISTFFINHNFARYLTDIHHHVQPFYYYLPVLVALFFPWSGWLLVLTPRSFRENLRRWREWRSGTIFAACWFFVPIIFFSFSGSKLPGYILPSLPPLALILGSRLAAAIQEKREIPRLRTALWAQLFLSFCMAVAAPVFFYKDYGGNWKTGLCISAAALIPAIFAFVYGHKGNSLAAVKATVAQGTILIAVVALFAFPVLGDYMSTRTIARQALALRESGEPLVFWRFFHHTFQYYTDYQAQTRLDDMDALRHFAETAPSFLAITKEAGMRELENHPEISVKLLFRQGNFLLIQIGPMENAPDDI
jgi:4-amino-4-deoxy-L-arabinose transferase-like glycosyltransferase